MDAALVWSAAGSGATAGGVVATVVICRLQARAAARQALQQVTATNFAGRGQCICNMAQPESPAGSGPAVLRAPAGRLPGHLRGRDELPGRVEALLEQGDGQVHVLAGPGGTGKSTIALRLAGKAAGHGMPAWRVPAAGTETMTGELLGLAAGLGAPPGEVDQARAGQRSPADLAGWPSLVTPIPGLAWAG